VLAPKSELVNIMITQKIQQLIGKLPDLAIEVKSIRRLSWGL
jgi:hypothetical protein